jgi:hypothetical protein
VTTRGSSVVVVWPDRDQSEQEVLRLLRDVPGTLHVAHWDPDDAERGRTALLASLREARDVLASRDEDPDTLIVIGFGHGAVALAGLTRYAKRLGIGVGKSLCVAPRWDEPDPFSGSPLTEVPERVELVPDAREIATCWRPR